MRLARVQAGRVAFDDLVEICRHHAGAGQDDELVRFALAAVPPIEQQLGKLSVAAFLGEVLPLVPPHLDLYPALAEHELFALLNTGSVVAATRRAEAMLIADQERMNAEPTSDNAQRNLAVGHERMGDLWLLLGDGAQAKRHYRDSLTIRERVTAADPANAEAQRDLSVSYEKLGDLLLRLDDLPQAERHYRDSLAIRERLATADPANTQAQRDLSVPHDKLGDLLLRLDDLPQAERHYRDSHAIRERLAAADPANAEGQQDLLASHVRLGDLLTRAGDHERARHHHGDALAIVERLAGPDHPLAVTLREKLGPPADDGIEPAATQEPEP